MKVAQPCEHIETIELYTLKGYFFFLYVNTFLNSQFKKKQCEFTKNGDILNITANTKNIANPNLIDFGVIFFYLFF